VSGRKKIRMEELKALYESLSLRDVKTYIQSGNVVFSCPGSRAGDVRGEIERAIERTFGFQAAVIVRTREEFERVIRNNPFTKKRKEDIAKLYVTFLSEIPAALSIEALENFRGGPDEFHVAGKEVYVFCSGGYGRTRFNNTFFEKKLGVAATTRNWKTMNALFALAE